MSDEMKEQECDNVMEQAKSENEVLDRDTTSQAWFLRTKSTKGNNFSIAIASFLNLLHAMWET